jgi:hypothetical protein
VQDDAADQLHVDVAHVERPAGGLPDHGEGFGQDLVERLLTLPLELARLSGRKLRGLVRIAAEIREPGLVLGGGCLAVAEVRAADPEPPPELVGLGPQLGVGQPADLLVEGVDLLDDLPVALELALGGIAGQLGPEGHGWINYPCARTRGSGKTGGGPEPVGTHPALALGHPLLATQDLAVAAVDHLVDRLAERPSLDPRRQPDVVEVDDELGAGPGDPPGLVVEHQRRLEHIAVP